MNIFLKKIILNIPGSLLPVLINFFFIIKNRILNKNLIETKKVRLFNFKKFKNNSKNPLFIIGAGSSLNTLTNKEKKFIEKSCSVGINFVCAADINTNFLTWERPKNRSIQELYLELLEVKKKKNFKKLPNLLLHDSFLEEGYDSKCFSKYFEKIYVYSTARIKNVNQKKLKNIYKYLYNPFFLNLLDKNMTYGLHSTLDRLTHLAIISGFKKIVFIGVDLKNSYYFWQRKNFKNKIYKKLLKQININYNKEHLTERKHGKIPVSNIIECNFHYATSKGIKLYTSSKYSKLASFLPIYKFPKGYE